MFLCCFSCGHSLFWFISVIVSHSFSVVCITFHLKWEEKRKLKYFYRNETATESGNGGKLIANVCHAYQILHRHGIPDENIVTMMFDDIANNSRNPYKGVIINRPNGTNVYKGILKDYTGIDVNPANFLNILRGNKTAMKHIGSGKVIESGPNDRIFVYFTDHGGIGQLIFPNGVLYADTLINTLKDMLNKKSFKELLFYIEACFSGSMFEQFLEGKKDIEIVASTSANSQETSSACYYDIDIGTCLSDEYSVAWMEHVERTDGTPTAKSETVMQQYEVVKKCVKSSHPQLYGGDRIKHEKVHNFIGLYKETDNSTDKNHETDSDDNQSQELVSIRDAALYSLQQKFKLAKTEHDKARYAMLIHHMTEGRKLIDDTFDNIVIKVAGSDENLYTTLTTRYFSLDSTVMPCYKYLISQLKEHCFDYLKNKYALSHFQKLVNMCASSSVNVENIVSVFQSVCTNRQRSISGID